MEEFLKSFLMVIFWPIVSYLWNKHFKLKWDLYFALRSKKKALKVLTRKKNERALIEKLIDSDERTTHFRRNLLFIIALFIWGSMSFWFTYVLSLVKTTLFLMLTNMILTFVGAITFIFAVNMVLSTEAHLSYAQNSKDYFSKVDSEISQLNEIITEFDKKLESSS